MNVYEILKTDNAKQGFSKGLIGTTLLVLIFTKLFDGVGVPSYLIWGPLTGATTTFVLLGSINLKRSDDFFELIGELSNQDLKKISNNLHKGFGMMMLGLLPGFIIALALIKSYGF